jgi:hypothetical protein
MTVTGTVQYPQLELGATATSYIPNPGTGTAVRTGDFAGGGISGASLTALFPTFASGTIVFKFRKKYSLNSNETLFAFCAGASYGTGNGMLVRTRATNIQYGGNSSSDALNLVLTLDGETINTVAVSWDVATQSLSVAANGVLGPTLTTLDFTGSGTTHLLFGSLTTGGLQTSAEFTAPGIRVAAGQYITGSALQALSQ